MSPSAAPRFPGAVWQRYIDPQEAGFSPAGLEEARAYAQRLRSAAVLILRGGAVVCDWGPVERRFRCHALRESLLHAALGQLHAAGRLDIEATLKSLGLEEVPPLTPSEKSARLADLLEARSGIYRPAAYEATRPPGHPAPPSAKNRARAFTTVAGTSTPWPPYSSDWPTRTSSRSSSAGSPPRWACRILSSWTAITNATQGVRYTPPSPAACRHAI